MHSDHPSHLSEKAQPRKDGKGQRTTLAVLRSWPMLVLALLLTVSFLAPVLAPHDPLEQDLRSSYSPPTWAAASDRAYLLGTDQLGRDVLSRTIYSARVSLIVAVVGVGIGTAVGATLGLIAGYRGRTVDIIITRLVDAGLAFPVVVVALLLSTLLGSSFTVILLLIVLYVAVQIARVVRSRTRQVMAMDFVALARAAGARGFRIVRVHLLPNVVNSVVVMGTWLVGQAIIIEGGLSFLGLGIPPPTPTWGSMISDGRTSLDVAWWISVVPGLAMTGVVLTFNALGDRLRDAIDPHIRKL